MGFLLGVLVGLLISSAIAEYVDRMDVDP